MKYAKETLKYIKSNPLLLPCFAVAVLAMAALVNPTAYAQIAASCTGNSISDSFLDWFKFLILLNTENWATILTGVAAYIVLILDLAFIHSLVDKHIRFGSRSFRSIASGFNINVVNSFIFAVFTVALALVVALLMTAILKTFSVVEIAGIYIVGIVLCALLFVLILFAASLFLLWLPCVEITGFKKYEALTYSYSLARPRVKSIFAAFAVPMTVVAAVCIAVELTANAYVTYIVLPILLGAVFVYSAVLGYIAYAEAEGIEREDLRKY